MRTDKEFLDLDILMAEKVMGFQLGEDYKIEEEIVGPLSEQGVFRTQSILSRIVINQGYGLVERWAPSRSISDAFDVVEEMGLFRRCVVGRDSSVSLRLWQEDNGTWVIGDYTKMSFKIAEAETLPLVICLTALKVLELRVLRRTSKVEFNLENPNLRGAE